MNQFLIVINLLIKNEDSKNSIAKEIAERLSEKGFTEKILGNDLTYYRLPAGTFIIETSKSKNLIYKEVYDCCFKILSLVFYDHIKTKFSFIMSNVGNSLQWFRLEKS